MNKQAPGAGASRQPPPARRPGASLPRWIVWTRRILVAVGSAAIVNAAVGLPTNLTLPREQRDYVRFFMLASVVILMVVLPAVLAVGRLLHDHIPAPFRAVLQGGLFASFMIVIVALPALVGAGHAADLPSALPRDYARGLGIALGSIWAVALVVIVVIVARTRRRGNAA